MSLLFSKSAYPIVDAPCRHWLLQRARLAVASYFSRTPLLPPAEVPPAAEQLRGCFVTLQTQAGRLRGCTGWALADTPLWQNAERMAQAAALHDRRFAPLAAHELEDIVFEISVLAPQQKVKPSAIVIGQHGLWVRAGDYEGVLLPQVASSYQWDVKTFLRQACLEAGLEADAWRDEQTDISTFTAEVFAETSRLT